MHKKCTFLLSIMCVLLFSSCNQDSGNDTENDWMIQEGNGHRFRAIHLTGNWGTNVRNMKNPPESFLEYLRDLNVNWVGISVALHVADSMDSTVESIYSNVQIPTFSDDSLRSGIRAFRKKGFHIYLTLAFEDLDSKAAAKPVDRWNLGNPYYPEENKEINKDDWPWDINHPDHSRFVTEFFNTYTERAVHYGEIAEQENVELFSIGTETDLLFRTRPGGSWGNDYFKELNKLVQSVRSVYKKKLTYDMSFWVLKQPDWLGYGSDYLWSDLGLDIVGVSAYFPLVVSEPTNILSVSELEGRWSSIAESMLKPLKSRNPSKPILFLEFGYVDVITSPFNPIANSFSNRIYVDADHNGLDDGEETQANIYSAFLNLMDREPYLIEGAFHWENWIATDAEWRENVGIYRTLAIRNKTVEDVVKSYYLKWK